jgi:cytochrome c-type biogenesis protein
MSFDVSFVGALVAGLLSFVSPCVLPLVPPYLCFLAGVTLDQLADQDRADAAPTGRVLAAAFAFVLGFATVFVLLGATASALSGLLIEHFGLLAKFAGAIIILFGLHLIGLLRVGLFDREARVHPQARPTGPLGAYAIGLAFAFGWTPCVGPVLATILTVAATKEQMWQGAVLLGAYALGIGVPFLAAAAFAAPFLRLMRRLRRWTRAIETVMGILLIVTGVAIFSGAFADMGYWLLQAFPALGRIG